jgi:hypothetical protein
MSDQSAWPWRNQNMVMILNRFCLIKCARDGQLLTKIRIGDIQPRFKIAAACADVVIIKDGKKFAVLKHNHMMNVIGYDYPVSTLKNIMFAR